MLNGAGAQAQRGATVSVYFTCGEKEAKPLGFPKPRETSCRVSVTAKLLFTDYSLPKIPADKNY